MNDQPDRRWSFTIRPSIAAFCSACPVIRSVLPLGASFSCVGNSKVPPICNMRGVAHLHRDVREVPYQSPGNRGFSHDFHVLKRQGRHNVTQVGGDWNRASRGDAKHYPPFPLSRPNSAATLIHTGTLGSRAFEGRARRVPRQACPGISAGPGKRMKEKSGMRNE